MASSRRKFNFGYPDGYGAIQYPPAYDATASSTAFLQYQFRAEQKDFAPPNTALKDEEGDRDQEEFKKKYPLTRSLPHSGLSSFLGFAHDKANFDYVFFQSKPVGYGAISFKEWLKSKNIDPNKLPE
jgi:hypothetical protein